jgi:uncharacterized protein (DUF433 family)
MFCTSLATSNPEVMVGKPCIRGMRLTVGMTVVLAVGHSNREILAAYPYLAEEDIRQALAYAFVPSRRDRTDFAVT